MATTTASLSTIAMTGQPDNNKIQLSHRLSIVVPMYNEEDNVEPMLRAIHNALKSYAYPWELIVVDDGSTDATARLLKEEIATYGSHVRVACLQRNFGQTAAMQAGIDLARGDIIATMDGDLQNDPSDIPRMVDRLLTEDLDLLSGWRKNRQDNLIRRFPSMIANRIIRSITRVTLHDYGCSLKIFRASVIKQVRLYGEMHRFIPAWTATHTAPARIKEEVVNHNPRIHGTSKYGLSRTFRVILDLGAVYFFMRYRSRPGHFFGKIGFFFAAMGSLILFYLTIVKFIMGQDIGARPLLLIGVLFMVVAVQLFTTGVLSEMLSRTYYESGEAQSYTLFNAHELEQSSAKDWKQAE